VAQGNLDLQIKDNKKSNLLPQSNYNGYYYCLGGLYMLSALLFTVITLLNTFISTIELYPHESRSLDLPLVAKAQAGWLFVPSELDVILSDQPARSTSEFKQIGSFPFFVYNGTFAYSQTELGYLSIGTKVWANLSTPAKDPVFATLVAKALKRTIWEVAVDITNGSGFIQVKSDAVLDNNDQKVFLDYSVTVSSKEPLKHGLEAYLTISLENRAYEPQGNFKECTSERCFFDSFTKEFKDSRTRYVVLKNKSDKYVYLKTFALVPTIQNVFILCGVTAVLFAMFTFALKFFLTPGLDCWKKERPLETGQA
jgi:hypothetical protein